VRVIDPAPAVARQAVKVMVDRGRGTGDRGWVSYTTSGDVAEFERVQVVLGIERGEVRAARWRAGKLTLV
jgi:hypothetical protein